MAQASQKSRINIEERFSLWTRGSAPGPALCLNRDYYAGRMTESDVNSKTLDQIYGGLNADVGKDAAKNFLRLVDSLEDFHTSLFIDAFLAFWASGCKLTRVEQRTADRDEPLFSAGGGGRGTTVLCACSRYDRRCADDTKRGNTCCPRERSVHSETPTRALSEVGSNTKSAGSLRHFFVT